jgi:tRNA dimethylallyltransferase
MPMPSRAAKILIAEDQAIIALSLSQALAFEGHVVCGVVATEADGIAAARIHPNDRRRTVRALEVWMTTGRRISELQRQWNDAPRELPPGWAVVGLEWPVDLINERINRRVRAMVEAGLEREVMALIAKGPLNRQAIEAVGYEEVLRHFAHECSMDEAEELIKVRTRRYARQQRTWLRRFKAIPGAIWIDGPMTPTEAAAGLVIETLFGAR